MSPSESKVEDRALIIRAQQGEKQAFDQIFQRYQRMVYRAAFGLVGNVEEAMDVTQEAFMRAYRAIQRFEPERPFFPWIYKIVRNLAYSSLGKRSRKGFAVSLDTGNEDSRPLEIPDPSQSPREEYSQKELETHLAQALEELKAEDREIIVLRDLQNHSYKEIAQMLDIPMGTVMSRLYYGRERLRIKMEKYL